MVYTKYVKIVKIVKSWNSIFYFHGKTNLRWKIQCRREFHCIRFYSFLHRFSFLMRSLTIFTILFLFGTAFCYYWGQQNPNDRVLLSSVNALTFYRSKYTTGRRSRYQISYLISF